VSGVAPDDYWAAGARIIDRGFDQRTYVEHWDGAGWRSVTIPKPKGSFNDLLEGIVALDQSSVWAVGWAQPPFTEVAPFAAQWDGQRWTERYLKVPRGAKDTMMHDIDASSDSDVWAVGDAGIFRAASALIEHWNGSGWTIAAPPAHQPARGTLSDVDVVSTHDVWSVGYSRSAGRIHPLAERYDGQHWSLVQVPPPPGQSDVGLTGVAAVAEDDVWVTGTTDTETGHPFVEHWNGRHWQTVSITVPGNDMVPLSIDAVAPDDVWVAGGNSHRQPVFAHWDGSSFHYVKVALDAQTVFGIDFTSSRDGVAVGISTTKRNGHRLVVPAHAHWNGHNWTDHD
jgi:photosystem II stability/assembly factor-like uncharacterized protein